MSQDIRLRELWIKNFKGLRDFQLCPDGRSISVYGENRTGKTTIMDAWLWLLFGKDSLNQSDFELKAIDAESGEAVHGLEHEVSAKLSPELTLTKRLTEKWTKRRGSAERVFTGHQVDHFIDGVPQNKREFDRAVSGMADEQLFRLLSNPRHFNEVLHWTRRREILLEVCGDITDEDVIASSPVLSQLPAILGTRSLDDHRKVCISRRNEINRELDQIPVRISEVQKSMGGITDKQGDVEWTLKELRTKRTEKQAEIQRITSGGELAEKTMALRGIEAEIQRIETEARRDQDSRIKTQQEKLFSLRGSFAALERLLRKVEVLGEATQAAIQRDEERMGQLREEWQSVNAMKFDAANSVCPTCGQNLPDGKLQETISQFNLEKSNRFMEISSKGKLLKASVQKYRQELEQVSVEIASLTEQRDITAGAILELESKITSLRQQKPTPDGLAQLMTGKETLLQAIKELKAGTASTEALEQEVSNLDSRIQVQEEILAKISGVKASEKRIETLKAQERELAREFEQIERELGLCDLFLRTKVSLLTDRINSKFSMARFKLFSQNINGGIEPCCEVMVDSIPYGSLNNAGRINVGIDITNTLSEHYGVTLPQWIDNAESVVDLLPSRGQQIRLVVSGQDKTLRIEKEGQNG